MSKVLFVATVVKTHIMEFHIPYLKMFKENGWETSVAARNDYENKEECVIPFCDNYTDVDFARFPFSKKNISAYKSLKRLISEEEFDIVHCHTPVGGVLARLASRKARKKGTKVIYTAHGFHFYKGAPLLNWLIYFPVEWICSFFTDVLITINSEDYEFAKRYMHAKEIKYVSGVGIDTNKFSRPTVSREEKREELGFQEDFIVLSVGELIKRKNHKMVIDAIFEIRQKDIDFYNRLQYLICGRGELDQDLKKYVKELGIDDHVHFLGYRSDIVDICYASDLFVFMSIHEGLPVALMEAMTTGLPIIASTIRGNVDLIENEKNGILISNDVDELANAILSISNRKDLGNAAKISIERFGLDSVLPMVKEIYGI